MSPIPKRKPRARPRRGTPDETRERLVAAAAAVFNRDGYHGTDSNRIARAAGYAAGTFYKHFADKREILLAAYEAWVTSEWSEVERDHAAAAAEARANALEIARAVRDRVKAEERGARALVVVGEAHAVDDDVLRAGARAYRDPRLGIGSGELGHDVLRSAR